MMFNKGPGRLPRSVNESTTNVLQEKKRERQLKKKMKTASTDAQSNTVQLTQTVQESPKKRLRTTPATKTIKTQWCKLDIALPAGLCQFFDNLLSRIFQMLQTMGL